MPNDDPLIFGRDEPPVFVFIDARTDDGAEVERVSFGHRSYHQVASRGKTWREAESGTEADGSTVFRAAEMTVDGTLVGHLESRGPSRRVADLRVEPDGSWKSVVQMGKERIESSGQLRAAAEPTQSQRTFTRGEAVLWTADAITEFNVTDEDGSRVARRTSGTIKFAHGGVGSFRTDHFSIGTRGVESDASWKPVSGLGPNQSGTQKVTPLAGGGSELVRHIVDHKTGERRIDTWTHERKEVPGGVEHVESEKHMTISASGKVSETSVHEQVRIDVSGGTHWTTTTTHLDGKRTVERGEFTSGEGAGSVSKSIVHSDGSVTIETTTWNTGTFRGQQHTTVTGPNGEPVSDTTTHGKMNITNHHHRPGDIGPIYQPDPPNSGDTNEDSDDTDNSNNGDDTDDGDDADDSGGADGDTEEEHGGDSGDDETEISDDGFGGDDTGGYPGLGWDAGDSGPLALLPAMAAAGVGRYDDLSEPIDTLGDDSALASFLAEAVKHAAVQDDSEGLGADTGDPLHGVSQSQLAAALRAMKPVDPEWGDWRNPKAHAVFVRKLTTDVNTLRVDTSALEIGTSLTRVF